MMHGWISVRGSLRLARRSTYQRVEKSADVIAGSLTKIVGYDIFNYLKDIHAANLTLIETISLL